MTDSAFIKAICDSPGDDLPRLVYADYLEENAGTVACGACRPIHGKKYTCVYRDCGPYDSGWERCSGCRGSGVVSDGRRERAEFIRVQCELERLDAPTLGEIASGAYPDRKPLRLRERELWVCPQAGSWFGEFGSTYSRSTFDGRLLGDKAGFVSRGFVSEINCTPARFFGAVCPHCSGRGTIHNDMHHSPDTCNLCKGKGRTAGAMPSVFRDHPVERVYITDAVIHRSGGNGTYYVGGLGVFPSEYWSRLENLPSVHAAVESLSAVCVAYGRALALTRERPANAPGPAVIP